MKDLFFIVSVLCVCACKERAFILAYDVSSVNTAFLPLQQLHLKKHYGNPEADKPAEHVVHSLIFPGALWECRRVPFVCRGRTWFAIGTHGRVEVLCCSSRQASTSQFNLWPPGLHSFGVSLLGHLLSWNSTEAVDLLSLTVNWKPDCRILATVWSLDSDGFDCRSGVITNPWSNSVSPVITCHLSGLILCTSLSSINRNSV